MILKQIFLLPLLAMMRVPNSSCMWVPSSHRRGIQLCLSLEMNSYQSGTRNSNQKWNSKFTLSLTMAIEKILKLRINRLLDVNSIDYNTLISCINILNLFYHSLPLDM